MLHHIRKWQVLVSITIYVAVLALLGQTVEAFTFRYGRVGTAASNLRMSTILKGSAYTMIVDGACESMRAKVEAGEAPEAFVTQVSDFLVEYAESNQIDGTSPDVFKNNVGILLKSVGQALADPYKFAPCHKAIRDPFDYYQW